MSMSWRKHQSGLNELCKELLEKGVAVRTIDEAHLHPWQVVDYAELERHMVENRYKHDGFIHIETMNPNPESFYDIAQGEYGKLNQMNEMLFEYFAVNQHQMKIGMVVKVDAPLGTYEGHTFDASKQYTIVGVFAAHVLLADGMKPSRMGKQCSREYIKVAKLYSNKAEVLK